MTEKEAKAEATPPEEFINGANESLQDNESGDAFEPFGKRPLTWVGVNTLGFQIKYLMVTIDTKGGLPTFLPMIEGRAALALEMQGGGPMSINAIGYRDGRASADVVRFRIRGENAEWLRKVRQEQIDALEASCGEKPDKAWDLRRTLDGSENQSTVAMLGFEEGEEWFLQLFVPHETFSEWLLPRAQAGRIKRFEMTLGLMGLYRRVRHRGKPERGRPSFFIKESERAKGFINGLSVYESDDEREELQVAELARIARNLQAVKRALYWVAGALLVIALL